MVHATLLLLLCAATAFPTCCAALSDKDPGDIPRNPRRATVAPIGGLSLLDLPAFSRGDRPSSMDKTLGAIFSKVAFTATNQSAPPALNATIPLLQKNADDVNADPSDTTGDVTTTTALPTTTTTTTTTAAPPTRAKPVFELDSRIFDFIPYDRTPPPPDPSRAYNPNAPGLRGPSRINTASNHHNNKFNLRPTLPPLIDLKTKLATSPTTTTTTTTTTSTTTSTTSAPTTTTTTTPTPPTTTPMTTAAIKPTTVEPNPSVQDHLVPSETSFDSSRRAAWSIQVYGASALFALLGLFALSNLLRLRTSSRRLLSTSHCLSIQLLVLFLAITRSIHLLYDAYNHRRLLPSALAFCIFNVAFPCLSSALAVLLLGILKATKLQVMPRILVKPALWAALVAFHFALGLSIDIVVGSVGGLFSLHLASQAYFVLWSLALSLGYFAAFGPAVRAAESLQAETMRTTLTALHIHGAGTTLPRQMPQPTLLRAVRITLAATILALLVAAFQLYGMFGIYGLPWRQPPPHLASASTNSQASSAPVVFTEEFLARYRDRNLNVDALRQVLGISEMLQVPRDPVDTWPVAIENFWPWWTYQLIARILEFAMAAFIAYVAAQPSRYTQTLTEKSGDASGAAKKSALWLFTGRSLKSGSMETLSTLCCQSKGARGHAREMDLSPVKSMSSETSQYPAHMRNYCYANPSQMASVERSQLTSIERPSMPLPAHSELGHSHMHHAGTLPSAFPMRAAAQQQQRCSNTLAHPHSQISSVLVNDNGFIRFRDGVDAEQPYEDVDRNHPTQHIYQELGNKPHSMTYYSTSSSMASSSLCSHNKGATTGTPSTSCTYEHLCRRGLAGYYEPQRYEMQLPNAQLLSLLAKDTCHIFQPNIYGSAQQQMHALRCQCQCQCQCQGLCQVANDVSDLCKSPNYESYGPKPEAQSAPSPAPQSDVLQVMMTPVDLRSTPIFL